MSYTEHLVRSSLVCCTWEQTTDCAIEHRVVPDACVDLIWTGDRLTVAGPDTGPRLVRLAAGARLVGARLRPGTAGAVLGLPADELRDVSPDAVDVLGRDGVDRLVERLAAGIDPRGVLLAALTPPATQEPYPSLSNELAGARPDPLVRAAIVALDRPAARVAAVAAELGVSARQLQRRVSAAVGYGPKTLARVLRFRRLQALPEGPLVERALEAGYADQAHMTAEVTALAGVPPVRFLKDRTPTAA
jgi:AraC-like DNA-binding protein